MPVIEAKNLSKVFGKNPKQALKLLDKGYSKEDILKETGNTVGVNRASFSVEAGEIFVIMGLSGSGKSTLVRLLNRLIEPTEGNILIDEQDLATMDKKSLRNVRREKLSMVFQKFALFPHRTILQNAEFGLEIQNVAKEEREKKAKEALEMVGLGEYIHQTPGQLSGGMQQRVGLARALANDPEVLLMDEAFSALDPLIRKEMQDELIDLQSTMKKTIVFITHDLDEALRLGDRIALMKDGSIVQIGTPEEILVNPANDYVEKFVEDVDRSKVLTAQHIMKRPETVNLDKHGPRVALERMREEGLSSMYVIDSQRNLKGYITADDASEARKKEITSLKEILKNDIPRVEKDTSMNDIFSIIHDSPIPVAVVEDGKLVGIIVRGAVIAALSQDGEVNLDAE
ncbi:quaternary amine ABC transporter ATP-binding protein [Virgibacillus halodenitrificans]|uniref:Quaternary amine transport ATP-binding protein n=1 Tax=Virgibacillus halodenitrificans TaxID=1482 RepID=A0AAC9IYD0_VIRHA|nr:glycine betaine/L-proline ABC transporter ATP-binding protein [Virgibacillus halodenitrificans]APC47434.1 glycine betaine/L-proline ABC transporter ATP-binding protein [Virgibacillus halodenitrificans]MBD1221718.1 glycine betaine/L-proline ABC transporter ATP-binding protein [Virgibacillus halodenitrificans]MCG1029476.1 glycine betaine/L-proline ABC transporter ATP-binding protein [Virgibacillus halodenitrificans]MCJ0932253.1 glycine betaine/L-proline ABC transporter ATP-binding protein [Vir